MSKTGKSLAAKLGLSASHYERYFETLWRALGGEPYEREYVFDPDRKWRFDFAWPPKRVALEIEGGERATGRRRGRHVRAEGFTEDCRKYNAATAAGWRIIRASGQMIEQESAEVIEMLVELLAVSS